MDFKAIALNFLDLRVKKEYDELIKLIDENFALDHFRDGKINGRDEYRKYLDANEPPPGTWEEPIVEGNVVKITGQIKKFMMNWTVHSALTFTDEGKICDIKLWR
eukprot:TRINITY_DN2040_c0_g2_i2.p2 TRINITY_DN2040_c0_g2~~TRINITY_DN2040_c0_g2_i2.p2  ORF type:complete len:105 (+),score=39.15 TRINITY_DN2040_c0_g2_i2:64-378(+)